MIGRKLPLPYQGGMPWLEKFVIVIVVVVVISGVVQIISGTILRAEPLEMTGFMTLQGGVALIGKPITRDRFMVT